MKIAVCAKQIPDPANEVTYSDGIINRPDEQVLDDTDRYGIEVALQLKEKFDAEVTIISMGPAGTQKGLQQALQMGAEKAKLPFKTFASYVKGLEVGDNITLTRQTVEGSEKVNMPEKCVISVTAGGVEPRYPNFKDIMAAKSKPIEQISLGDLNIVSEQNVEFLNVDTVESSKAGEKIIDEGEAYQEIVNKLRELKVI